MEHYQNWIVALPKTAAAWEAGEIDAIEGVLENELDGKLLDFVDDSCESGGWPTNHQVAVERSDISGDILTAEVSVCFTEEIPSACKDLPYHEIRDAQLVIRLERGTTTGTVQYSTTDRSTWDLIDYNSAADGM